MAKIEKALDSKEDLRHSNGMTTVAGDRDRWCCADFRRFGGNSNFSGNSKIVRPFSRDHQLRRPCREQRRFDGQFQLIFSDLPIFTVSEITCREHEASCDHSWPMVEKRWVDFLNIFFKNLFLTLFFFFRQLDAIRMERFFRLYWMCPTSKIWITAFRTIWYKQLKDVCYKALNSVFWLLGLVIDFMKFARRILIGNWSIFLKKEEKQIWNKVS